MAVKINIPTINGLTLKTKGKYVADDIFMNVDIPKYDGSVTGEAQSINPMKTLLDGRQEAKYLFQNYTGTSVEDVISYSDTENVTNMNYMFSGCSNLLTIPQLNTSNVTEMLGIFEGCTDLQTIPSLDISNVTRTYRMFYNCQDLQSIPQLNTSNVTDIGWMFYWCRSLKIIDITSMDKITSTSNTQYLCQRCYSLTKFIIRNMTVIPPLDTNSFNECYHFNGTINATYNPEGLKSGRIYVPDDKVEELKQATNWSAYADIIVPLSTLEE